MNKVKSLITKNKKTLIIVLIFILLLLTVVFFCFAFRSAGSQNAIKDMSAESYHINDTDVSSLESITDISNNSTEKTPQEESSAYDSSASENADKVNSVNNTVSEDSSSAVNDSVAPSHKHVWKDHTSSKRVWISDVVEVPVYETKTIYGAQFYTEQPDGTFISNGPTYWFEDGFTIDDLKEIIRNALKNGHDGVVDGIYYGNYVNRTKTEKIQTGTKQEDQGHYETEYYVDYQYCDCGATR